MSTTVLKKNTFLIGIFVIFAFVPLFFTYAEDEDTLDSLRARIIELEAEVTQLKADIVKARGDVESVQAELALTRDLFVGMEGDDVKRLQEWLAQFKDIYPEGIVTGYYGPLTERAIKRLQQKHGLEQAGTVGAQTREKIRVMLAEGASLENIPAGLAKKVTVVTTADADEVLLRISGKGKVNICQNGKTIEVAVASLRAHIQRGATGGVCPVDTDTSDDDEDEEGEEEEGEDEGEEENDEGTE